MTALREAIVAEARTWLKTPFQHQARLKGVGCDCVGLPIGVCRALGLVPASFDVRGYLGRPDGRSLLAECDKHMTRIDRHALQIADVIVVRHQRDPQHLGIIGDYVHGGLSIIHALGTADGKGRVVEHRLDASTMARFIAAYRLPGVA